MSAECQKIIDEFVENNNISHLSSVHVRGCQSCKESIETIKQLKRNPTPVVALVPPAIVLKNIYNDCTSAKNVGFTFLKYVIATIICLSIIGGALFYTSQGSSQSPATAKDIVNPSLISIPDEKDLKPLINKEELPAEVLYFQSPQKKPK